MDFEIENGHLGIRCCSAWRRLKVSGTRSFRGTRSVNPESRDPWLGLYELFWITPCAIGSAPIERLKIGGGGKLRGIAGLDARQGSDPFVDAAIRRGVI